LNKNNTRSFKITVFGSIDTSLTLARRLFSWLYSTYFP